MRLVTKACAVSLVLAGLAVTTSAATVPAPASAAVASIRAELARELGSNAGAPASHATAPQSALAARRWRGAPTHVVLRRPATAAVTRTAPSHAGSYVFSYHNSNSPVRWNPCVAIPVLVNLSLAPAGARETLVAALAQLDKATGLRFYLAGTTDRQPDPYATSPTGAPVLVAWAKPGTRAMPDPGTSGLTYPELVGPEGAQVYTSGEIVLNAGQNSRYPAGFGVGHLGALLEHELGHLAGLDHVSDSSQVMYSYVGGVSSYQAGDLAGLAKLGQGGCPGAPASTPAG